MPCEGSSAPRALRSQIHLCAETGLGRGGLPAADLPAVAEAAAADPRLVLAGLWTHLASP